MHCKPKTEKAWLLSSILQCKDKTWPSSASLGFNSETDNFFYDHPLVMVDDIWTKDAIIF